MILSLNTKVQQQTINFDLGGGKLPAYSLFVMRIKSE